MTEHSARPSLAAIALAFTYIGLTSVGGAATPLRYVLVIQRRWIPENEFAEIFGVAQVLPGATGINVAVMIGDRLAGPLGPIVALCALCLPSLILAIVMASVATSAATSNARVAAGLDCVTAAVAGLFVANGLRLAQLLWRDARTPLARRLGQFAVIALGIVLVAQLHFSVPLAVAILATASILVERSGGTQTPQKSEAA